jgi:glycosyltransferase involved in cell wall biosynthesis
MTVKTESVRVLVCTLNGAPWLEAQLESLLAQTHTDWSLWVSDDGSTDGTREIIDRFGARNPGRLERVVDGPGRGAAANYLSLLCHPELPPGPVALCDQDDVWNPDKLARAVSVIAKAQLEGARGVAYAAGYDVVDAEGRLLRRVTSWPAGPSFGNALVQNIMSGHSLTLDAEALAVLRGVGPVEVPFHDWYIYQLMAGAGCRICIDPTPVLRYRQHHRNCLGDRGTRAALLRRARLLRQGTYRGWIAANCAALRHAWPVLTPDARATLATLDRRAQIRGLRRLSALRRRGVARQQNLETAVLHLAAVFGKA